MDSPLNGFSAILFVIVTVIFTIIIVGAFLIYRAHKRGRRENNKDTLPPFPHHRLDYQPETKTLPVIHPITKPAHSTFSIDSSEPEEIDFSTTGRDLTESLVALSDTYTMDIFTIATSDGLVLGSSGGDTAQNDAAVYSEQFRNNPLAETPGVILFGLNHKGSELIGIIRTRTSVSDKKLQRIAAETKNILDKWI